MDQPSSPPPPAGGSRPINEPPRERRLLRGAPAPSPSGPPQPIGHPPQSPARPVSSPPTQPSRLPVDAPPRRSDAPFLSEPSSFRSPSGHRPPSNRPQRPFAPRSYQQAPEKATLQNGRHAPVNLQPSRKSPVDIRAGFPGVRIIFLGGLGDVGIGKNMMALESGNTIVIIDCGIGFPTSEMLGVDLVIPDARYLEERKHMVRAYFMTHGHEDHVSALPFIWPKVPAPVYGTRLTLAMAGKKLEEMGLEGKIPMHVIKPGDKIQVGPFQFEPIRVNHAIPDCVGFAIRTPEGLIVNTGDWKIDHTPPFGDPIDLKRFAELGTEGILLLLSDSTTADVPGYTQTEKNITERLEQLFEKAEGRIIIASFASQINRIQQVFDAAKKFRRKVAIVGRSLERNASITLEHGYITIPDGLLTDVRQINRLPDNEICILATGSQGEQYAALTRMSTGDHRWVKIKAGDSVILSASIVPGNEAPVSATINNLYREGAQVYRGKDFDVHVSGHGGQEDLKVMFALTKPKYFVPIHGTFMHLVKHARLAQDMGIDAKHIFVAEDGDFVEILDGKTRLVQNKVESTYVLVDGSGVGDVGNIVLRDRQAMAKDGIFIVILTIDHKSGKMVTSPDIISRGFIYMRAAEDLVFKARQEIKNMFARHNDKYPMNWEYIKRQVREDLAEFLHAKTQRRPMVIPVIIEV
ncbi:RNase J family beta-CASP ribonuclease [Candidatus Berkelbacteria bacterium]|nr:RNase J family beta-CASP ribonuclease [Candidatus Berkelbacteria bacterium]